MWVTAKILVLLQLEGTHPTSLLWVGDRVAAGCGVFVVLSWSLVVRCGR